MRIDLDYNINNMETKVDNKCKAFTSLEQSKKLAEILPIESSDMNFHKIQIAKSLYGEPIYEYEIDLRSYNQIIDWTKDTIPCWSLAALLDVLPKSDLVKNSEETWLVHSWVNDYPWSVEVEEYSNPVDACYNMIIRLHELNLL